MNIGIVTQPLIANYGGLLQNFALQQVLVDMGHSPVTLDFMPGFTGRLWAYRQVRRAISYILGRWPEFIYPYGEGRRNRAIIDFVGRHIRTTRTFWNSYSPGLVDEYRLDAVVAGSDQVWRPCYNRLLEDMYLRFCRGRDIRRVAYGASFGTSEWEYTPAQADACGSLLKDFDAVSVREQSGLALLERLGRGDGSLVADPTVLLGREGFDRLLGKEFDHGAAEPYLGVYLLDSPAGYEDIVRNAGVACGVEHVETCRLGDMDMGPVQWIDMIRRASFFVTDSFHGTVFCLLYHVPFVAVPNSIRGMARFRSLLGPLGLENRLADSFDHIGTIDADIDWELVDKVLAGVRAESRTFLENALR